MDEENVNPTPEDILPTDAAAEAPAEMPEEVPAAEAPVEEPDDTNELEELRDYKARNEAANQELVKLMRLNPALVKTLSMMKEGASFEEAVARNIDLSALPVEGDPDYDKWSARIKEREDELAKSSEYENTINANREISQQNLREFAAENGMSEDQAWDFVATHISPLLDDLASLKFSKEFMTMIHKAVNHEAKVEEAKNEGITEGRNQKIEEEIMVEPPAGDGLPSAPSAAVMPKAPKKQSYVDYLKS